VIFSCSGTTPLDDRGMRLTFRRRMIDHSAAPLCPEQAAAGALALAENDGLDDDRAPRRWRTVARFLF